MSEDEIIIQLKRLLNKNGNILKEVGIMILINIKQLLNMIQIKKIMITLFGENKPRHYTKKVEDLKSQGFENL